MTTTNDLAREFGAQPYEVAAFADLGRTHHNTDIDPQYVEMIREAWNS